MGLMKVVNVEISKKLWDRLSKHARVEGTATPSWIRQVLRDHADQLDRCAPHIADDKRQNSATRNHR